MGSSSSKKKKQTFNSKKKEQTLISKKEDQTSNNKEKDEILLPNKKVIFLIKFFYSQQEFNQRIDLSSKDAIVF